MDRVGVKKRARARKRERTRNRNVAGRRLKANETFMDFNITTGAVVASSRGCVCEREHVSPSSLTKQTLRPDRAAGDRG